MAYATDDYYKNSYKGAPGGEDYLDRASDDIDLSVTVAIGDLTEAQADLLAKAACAQAEGYTLYGDPSSSVSGSVSLGSFSMSEGGAVKSGRMFGKANGFLMLSGLGYRGIARVGR